MLKKRIVNKTGLSSTPQDQVKAAQPNNEAFEKSKEVLRQVDEAHAHRKENSEKLQKKKREQEELSQKLKK